MYNRVILMGRLVRDPEIRSTANGISMCRISVAVDRNYAKQGEERQADFFEVTLWRQSAEFVCKYFSKGQMIHIEGRLQNNNYTDNNGVKHYSQIIIADSVSFCGDKKQSGGNPGPVPQNYNAPPQPQRPAQQPTAPAQNSGYNAMHRQPPQQQQQYPPPDQMYDSLGDFEEILSDGEVPF